MLALQITETILQKLPDVFVNSFIKEGVFFAIDGLLVPEKCSPLIFPVCNGIHLPLNSNQKSSSKVVMRCLCYAFDTGQSLSASETGTCKLEKDSIENLAKHIRISYFALESCDSEKGLTDILQKLRALSAELSDLMNMSVKIGSCTLDEEKCYSILCQIMEKLDGREPVSTFEFIESGIVTILVNYLFNGKYLREKVEPQSTFEVFARLLSSSDLSEESPLSALIQKLQGALSSLENFPVILSHASKYRSSFAIIPNGCCTIKGTEQIESAAQALEPAENVQFKSPSTANPSEGESSGLMEPDSMAFDLLDNEANLSQPPPELDVNLIQRNRDETLSNDTHIVSVEDIVQSPSCADDSTIHCTTSCSNGDAMPKLLLKTVFGIFLLALSMAQNFSILDPAVAYMLHPAFFSSIFNCELTSDLDKSSPTNDILFLLKSLEGLNTFIFHLMSHERIHAFAEGLIDNLDSLRVAARPGAQNEFVSSKLTEKLEQQMRDSVAVSIEEELERLLCGERDFWAFNELLDHIKFDHGYTASSPLLLYSLVMELQLLEIIKEFEYEQRRSFLQFVTGAPRLPTRGLASLNPKLTIVRKHCSNCEDVDLPSVMTCANYLKLPPYSSKDKMKEKLLYAITEGQGSFHLS
ncbi:hypothetical protein POTOM_051712 [Populus tomentosa]|uniref:HECT domain-containing protein n=1 Tax=Populus tomentosa TaxID=118781 RepID=A0A8X8C8H9_POPTO|nr:hypothetical protein POTOM_051712 [Populus tomentosa]